MSEKSWADLDPDWRAKEKRAAEERRANEDAALRGQPQPFVNPFWHLDPTKVGTEATPEEITRRYQEFSRICRRPTRKRHTI